jgi:hypothetical protein
MVEDDSGNLTTFQPHTEVDAKTSVRYETLKTARTEA